jgi:hypothetical protein
MDLFAKTDRTSSLLRAAVAVLCALLVVFAGVVQVTHAHINSMAPHANCSLCVAAHITVHLAQSLAPASIAAAVTRVDVLQIHASAGALSTFALFTRPPPAASFAV